MFTRCLRLLTRRVSASTSELVRRKLRHGVLRHFETFRKDKKKTPSKKPVVVVYYAEPPRRRNICWFSNFLLTATRNSTPTDTPSVSHLLITAPNRSFFIFAVVVGSPSGPAAQFYSPQSSTPPSRNGSAYIRFRIDSSKLSRRRARDYIIPHLTVVPRARTFFRPLRHVRDSSFRVPFSWSTKLWPLTKRTAATRTFIGTNPSGSTRTRSRGANFYAIRSSPNRPIRSRYKTRWYCCTVVAAGRDCTAPTTRPAIVP